MQLLQAETAILFAAVILFAVFFLIARVGRARQPIALAFALMPLLLAWAALGFAANAAPLSALL